MSDEASEAPLGIPSGAAAETPPGIPLGAAAETPSGIPTGFGPSGRVGAASAPVGRVRLTFSKEGALRYIGHLDLVRMWERAFRRARLPLAYTLGFTPHPRLTFAAPLALGATSEGELLDVYLREALTTDELVERIAAELPAGCAVRSAAALAVEGPPLTGLTRWAAYTVLASGVPGSADLPGAEGGELGSRWSRAVAVAPAEAAATGVNSDEVPWRPPEERLPPPESEPPLPAPEQIERHIADFLAAASVPFERARDGKRVDLRPLVLSLELAEDHDARRAGRMRLDIVVKLDAAGAGRPDEIVSALGLRARSVHRRRIGLEGESPPG